MVEFDAVRLGSILAANRDNLVRQNMVEDGNTKEQAEAQVDLILMIVENLGQSKLSLGSHEGFIRATLQWKLNLR